METKFTPGPWKYSWNRHDIKRGEGIRYFVFAEVKQMDKRDRGDRFLFEQKLSRIDDIELHNEAEANAKLIAAAPELYEALNSLYKHYEAHGQILTWDVNIARKALAKATH